jgi:hypothetical protein
LYKKNNLQVELQEYQLVIHGTKEMPIDYDRYVTATTDNVSYMTIYRSYRYNDPDLNSAESLWRRPSSAIVTPTTIVALLPLLIQLF